MLNSNIGLHDNWKVGCNNLSSEVEVLDLLLKRLQFDINFHFHFKLVLSACLLPFQHLSDASMYLQVDMLLHGISKLVCLNTCVF